MALRVTQQNVEILSQATGGKLRVTQFYIEALGSPGAELTVSDPITFVSTATETAIFALSASNSLALTDDAVGDTGGAIFNESASNTLALTDLAAQVFEVSASNAMTLTDQALYAQTFDESVSSTLTLTDSVTQVFDESVSDTLTFTDAGTEVFEVSGSNSLALTDTADPAGSVFLGWAAHNLDLTDTAFGDSSLINRSVADFLNLTQNAARTYELSVSSTLSLTQQAYRGFYLSHSMSLAHAVSTFRGLSVDSILGFSDVVGDLHVYSRALASILTFQDSALVETGTVDTCDFAPFVGAGPNPISATPPTVVASTFTLTYPFVSPTTTLVLRNPDFGNTIGYQPNRINRKTRLGTLKVFRNTSWPAFHPMRVNIVGLSAAQISDIKTFIANSLGKEIGVLDPDGQLWKMILVNPETEFTQIGGRSGCEDYAVQFLFEGALA